MAQPTFRPELHVSPESGVMDAPAGALCDGTTWHVFHQYRPQIDGPARWAHAYSDDAPFEWDICDDVITPRGDETSVRAGSVIATSHGARLYFTSVTPTDATVQVADIEDLDDTVESISDDPACEDCHVQRRGVVVDSNRRYRSPCVVRDWAGDDRDEEHEGWMMLAVAGSAEHPDLMVLSSEDGLSWTIKGALEFDGDPGYTSASPIVSPRIFRLRDEIDGLIYDLLLVTIEKDGIDRSGYLVGTLEETTFHVLTPFTRIDYGHDFSRPRTTTMKPGTIAPERRYEDALIFGLMNGVGRFDNPSTHLSYQKEGWANCLTLPRTVTLQGGLMYQTPTSGLIDAIGRSTDVCFWSGLFELGAESDFSVLLLDAAKRPACRITHDGHSVILDRSMNPHHTGDPVASAPVMDDDTNALTIIVDGSTVEVFADGGAVAMASRVYFEGGCTDLQIIRNGEVDLQSSYERFPRSAGTDDLPWDDEDLAPWEDAQG